MGEVRIRDALKTVQGICRYYGVSKFISVDIDRIAVYNVPNDNFHFFRWHGNRYVYDGSADTIPDWHSKSMAI